MAYLYVTMERFNAGNASATRILSFCEILHGLEKEVIVISLDKVQDDKIHVYKGINYTSIRSVSDAFVAKVFNFLFHRSRLKKCIAKLSKAHTIEGLFFYDIPAPSIFYLKKYARNKKIKVFHDSVEWYSPGQFKWGKLALPFIMKNVLNKYFIDKQIAVLQSVSILIIIFSRKGFVPPEFQ